MMTQLEKIVFAISESNDHRADLKKVLKDKTLSIQTLSDLDPKILYEQGIRVVVFDFDGVLTPHGDLVIEAKDLLKLQAFCEVFTQPNILIWSNNPVPARMRFLQEHFPGVSWLDGVDKPNPESLQRLIHAKGCDPKVVLMIDDRLLTGILAGILAGTQVRLVKKPKIRLKGNLSAELGFIILRAIERFVFRF